jgi:5-methyltetrahydropteroyltriglutamate--homocysteine methyltransferase
MDASKMSAPKILSAIVGSYPKPSYLLRGSGRALLDSMGFQLQETKDRFGVEVFSRRAERASRMAITDQDRAGLDIVSDGEERRQHYVLHVLSGLDGIDFENLQEAPIRNGLYRRKLPTLVSRISYKGPITVEEFRLAKKHARGIVKVNLPGPGTVVDTVVDNYYGHDSETLARDYAKAIKKEVNELIQAGCKAIQFDDPLLLRSLERTKVWALDVLVSCISDFSRQAMFFVHICRGYPDQKSESKGIPYKAPQGNYTELLSLLKDTPIHVISIEGAQGNLDPSVLSNAGGKRIMLGVIDVGDTRVETVAEIVRRGYEALRYLNPDQLILAPDCGMLQLNRRNAFKKLRNLSTAVKILNRELGL